jgi:hypothetical protein
MLVRIENGRTRRSYGENTDSLYGFTWLCFVYLREKQNLILQLSKMFRQYWISDNCFVSVFPRHICSQFQCLSLTIQINIDIHIYIDFPVCLCTDTYVHVILILLMKLLNLWLSWLFHLILFFSCHLFGQCATDQEILYWESMKLISNLHPAGKFSCLVHDWDVLTKY